MSRKLTTEEFIDRSRKLHEDKYDYSKVKYIDWNNKICIICKFHGEFFQSVGHHLRGYGCSKCGKNYRPTTEEFIKQSNKIHNDKYDYSLVKYLGCESKITIICKNHGKFLQRPICHLKGRGCPQCGIKKQSDAKRDSLDCFLLRARKIHGNRYDYSKSVYINNFDKMEIICPVHGSFFQSSVCHIYQTQGCPVCNFSKGELKIKQFLDDYGVEYICQKTFNDCRNPKTDQKLKFDFYVPSKKLLIEYDGPQHFMIGSRTGGYVNDENDLKNIKYRDSIKNVYATRKNLHLLRIKYTRFKSIFQLLSKQLET